MRHAMIGLMVLVAACDGAAGRASTTVDAATTVSVDSRARCADVVEVDVSGDGPYTFSVTVSSADTGWDKYADEWRVEDPTGAVLATRELTHPHVDEQPFTRTLSGVEIAGNRSVIVAARDSVEGYCGKTAKVAVG